MADNVEKIISVKFNAQQALSGLAQLNGAIATNNEQLKQMRKAGEEGTKAYAQLEQETKALKRQKQDLSHVVQNEVKQQEMLDGSLRSMRAELSTLTKQYDALSKAERENANVGGRLKSQINNITKELKEAEEGTQRYYRNVGNYKNAILDTIGANTIFGTSLTNIVNIEGGFKGAMTAMGNSVKAFSASLTALLTNPMFWAVAGVAGAGVAFKWWYDYNDGLAEATRHTGEFLGLTGNELQNVRDGIRATADTYGKDFMDVLRGVDTITAHWHVTSQEALDALNKGFASGADLSGNMLSLLNQYAPALHDAGFSAEQVLALIQQTRSGIFSEQGLEAIKQASARLRNMSSSTKQSLQGIGIDADALAQKLATRQMDMGDAIKLVAHHLKTVGTNSQQAGAVMSDVFGRQGKFASQEMIKGLEDIETNLDIVMQRTGEWGEDMDALREKDEQLKTSVADLFDVTGQGFEHTQAQAQLFVKEGLLRIVNALRQVVNWFKNVWNSSKAVRLGFVGLISILRVLSAVAFAPLKILVNGIKIVIEGIASLSNALHAVKSNIGTAFKGVAEIFRGIKDMDPSQVANGMRMALGGAWQSVKSFTGNVTEAFSNTFSNLKGMAVDFGRDIAGIFSDAGAMMDYTFDMSGGGGTSASGGGAGGDILFEDEDYTPTRNNKSTGKGKGATNKSTGNAKSDADKIAQQRKALIDELLKKAQQLQQKAMEEEAKISIAGINKLYDAQQKAIQDKYKDVIGTDAELNAAYMALIKDNEDKRKKAVDAYNAEQERQQSERKKKAEEFAKQLLDASVDNSPEGTAQWLQLRLQQVQMLQDAELAQYKMMLDQKLITQEQYEQMQAQIEAKYSKQRTDAQKQVADAEVEIQQAKYTAIGSAVGSLGELFGAFGEEQKEFVMLQKTLAMAEIMINQAVSISNAIKAASAGSITVWDMVAKIATGVAAVTAAMVQAFTSLDQAKFATGGYIRGAGTGTSDSIPIRVSNGESIMNANTTAMFGGLLSSLNQLGGGVPIQIQQTASSVQGEDMLARAIAKGVALLPNPVVSVEDINRGQRQVEVLNERATL